MKNLNAKYIKVITDNFDDFKEYCEYEYLPILKDTIDALKRNSIRTKIRYSKNSLDLVDYIQQIDTELECNTNFNDFLESFIIKYNITDFEEETIEVKKINFEDEAKYKTEHLPNFNLLNTLIAIHGNEYAPLNKLRYYQILGRITLDKSITFGQMKIDTRTNAIYAIPTTKGKKNYYANIKAIAEDLEDKHEAPTVFVSEQLIGKVIEREVEKDVGDTYQRGNKTGQPKLKKVKEYIPNNGYLDSDWLQMEESSDILADTKDRDIRECRRHVCIATDPYPENIISKKLIDHLSEERVKFPSPATQTYYIQPIKFSSRIVLSGFYRRFEKGYIKPKTSFKEIYNARLKSPEIDPNITKKQYVDWLKSKRELAKKHIWNFGEEENKKQVADALTNYSIALIYFARGHSKKGFELSQVLEQTVIERLLRYGCLIAFANGHKIVTENHIKLAYMDAIEFLYMDLEFIKDYCYGSIISGYKWNTTNQKEEYLLDWLQENNAISEELSVVTIDQNKSKICEIWNVGIDRANKIHRELVQKGLINSKQRKNKTKVWLSKLPNEVMGGIESIESSLILYKYVISNIKLLLEKSTNNTNNTTQEQDNANSGNTRVFSIPTIPSKKRDDDFLHELGDKYND